jgi:alkylation response protein AidB-like acyl-CoA dehydrogenase
LDALERVIDQVVSPNAPGVDRDGVFPDAAMAALQAEGFLGLTLSAELGGSGLGLAEAATVIERLASACGSTAMVTLMHYAAVAVVDAHGDEALRRSIASGDHLTTLAFSEQGSRSHFWAPIGTATATAEDGAGVRLDASKSWVTAAAEADSYVWSSRPLAGDGPMTLWTVDPKATGITVGTNFDGLGLRGNGSVPVRAEGVTVPASAQLGADGAGLDIALATALPWFLVLSSAFSLGLMEATTAETGRHVNATRFEHLGEALVHQSVTRADYATMRLRTDAVRAFLADTLAALGAGREDATLRVLESKALAAETALDVTDLAMKVCGGAAFRKELGIERRFRDARAARVMAPTTDALLDFIGRAISGLPLLGPLA